MAAAARAQQGERMRRVGVLSPVSESDASGQRRHAAFRKRLDELGWKAGRNIQIDYWRSAGNADRLRIFAKELVELKPDVILAETTPAAQAILAETRTVPIVFVVVSDPIGSGFVTSLNRPGGNVTGFMNMESTMSGKWLELLKEIAPRLTRVALLFDPAVAPYTKPYLDSFKAAAVSLAVEAIPVPIQQVTQLESVVAAQAGEPNTGLIMADVFLWVHRARSQSWPRATGSLRCIRNATSLKSVDCSRTEMIGLISIRARQPMPTASSRARSRASFPSRPRSGSSWSSTSGPPKRSASRCRFPRTRRR